MYYYKNEIIICEDNYREFLNGTVVDGQLRGRGLIPRDYVKHPVGSYPGIKAVDMPVIPQADWSGLLRAMVANKSLMSDIRMTGNNGQKIPSLDQGSYGYCWAHSTTSAMILARAVQGQPYVALSAFAVACIIKNFQNEGGWGAQSADFIQQRGVPSDKYWPMRSVDRANDNPNTWANAAQHKLVEAWEDVQAAQYDRNLTFQQFMTGFLCRCPGVMDVYWWSHSICGMDPVEGSSTWGLCRAGNGKLLALHDFERVWAVNHPVTAGFGVRILNSWSDSWGDQGMGILTGNQAIPDGGLLIRTTTPSEV